MRTSRYLSLYACIRNTFQDATMSSDIGVPRGEVVDHSVRVVWVGRKNVYQTPGSAYHILFC